MSLVLSLTGLLLLGLAARLLASGIRFYRTGIRTDAEVFRIDQVWVEGVGWTAVYRFEDRDAQWREGTFDPITIFPPDKLVGTRVRVVYDPRRPTTNQYDTPLMWLGVFLVPLPLGALSLLFFYGAHVATW